MNRKLHIPRGCDQQGRYPEAAHAACEEDDAIEVEARWRWWYTWGDILIAALAPAAVTLILLFFFLGWP